MICITSPVVIIKSNPTNTAIIIIIVKYIITLIEMSWWKYVYGYILRVLHLEGPSTKAHFFPLPTTRSTDVLMKMSLAIKNMSFSERSVL